MSINMKTDKDIISSVMEEVGLTVDDVKVLMTGYEKFTESSTEQKKELIDNVMNLKDDK